MRRAAKVDANQAEIIAALREAGVSVLPLSAFGEGLPDLLVGINGVNFLLEVKSRRGTLTPSQQAFFRGWRGQAVIVRSSEEALAAVGRGIGRSGNVEHRHIG